jgi:hypothetical protein
MRKLPGLVASLACLATASDVRATDTHQQQSFKALIEQGYTVKAIENAALGGSQDHTVVTMQMDKSFAVCIFDWEAWESQNDSALADPKSCSFR